MKTFKAHHVITKNGGRIAVRKRAKPIYRASSRIEITPKPEVYVFLAFGYRPLFSLLMP